MRNSVILGSFCLVVAVLLASVYTGTRERIQAQALAAERQALNDVFPAHLHDNDLLASTVALNPATPMSCPCDLLDSLTLRDTRSAYIASLEGDLEGAIIPVAARDGYSGDILLLVGILADGSITGVRVLEHRETPGLGDKIDIRISDWITQFDGKNLTPPAPRWAIVKDGGEFDQLVGATVTSRAVVSAVDRAVRFFFVNKSRFENLAN